VQWHAEADGALRHPLADAVTGALLDTGYQRRVIDYAVEDLAGRRLLLYGWAHAARASICPRSRREGAHCFCFPPRRRSPFFIVIVVCVVWYW
jgi:hypothetical protein